MKKEDYYDLPAFMFVYDIEKLIVDAIDDYNNGKHSYDDIVRIMYVLSDSFFWNIESMDLSDDIREKLEKFVFSLWKYKNDVNGELVLKVIFNFGLQQSYNKIISNIENLEKSNIDMYTYLNEVVAVNGKDISRKFEKYKRDKYL